MATKRLADNTEVPAGGYYYLLDWNDRDGFKTIRSYFDKPLNELNVIQYVQLFTIATNRDLDNLVEIFKEKSKKSR